MASTKNLVLMKVNNLLKKVTKRLVRTVISEVED